MNDLSTADEANNESRDDFRRRQQREAAAAWDAWFAELDDEARATLEAAGITRPDDGREGRRQAARDEEDGFGDPAESVAASELDNPIDKIEPATISKSEHAEIEEGFAQALQWSAQASSPVEMGRRLLVMLAMMRPALLSGIVYERIEAEEAELAAAVGAENLRPVGTLYGAVLEWMRRSTTLAQIGQRVAAVGFVLAVPVLAGQTLEQIACPTNKTRQQFDKLVCDVRDSFGGLRSRNMRDESHREECRQAQLKRNRPSES